MYFKSLIIKPNKFYTLRKECYWIDSISAKSMFIIDLNQNAIELVAYVSFLIEYFFESII